ncbi:uncharacterized protein LY89DRAFT_733175 [Mollisia scopiformis]|uniref:Chromo domain-containing protein n=1 Tax=Mollisia scopiformis TaxID=149040 RepID=A0A194XC38_MOLSC|nr:uncharacterized protein LY89DRAFT_733175 [Mollisia scopiformis]KUJ17317.1 hypothetical protein LY89DRAFT_733175 [Mollisia scopiformis]
MDPASRKRVRESTPRKATPSRTLHRESRSSPPRRKKQSGRPSAQEKDILWSLGTPGILEERRRANRVEYLLNWEGIDSKTGERYLPTWGKKEDVTEAAIQEWEQSKAEAAQAHKTESHPPESQDGQESQPIRTAKRKRGTSQRESSLQNESGIKKQRRAVTSDTPRFQPASERRVSSEIPDTYEEAQFSSRDGSGPDVRVEIVVPEGFDRDAYALAASSSQSSQNLKTAQKSSQSGVSQAGSPSQPRHRRPDFIWDEDRDSVVSDSWEREESILSKSLDTATKQTGSSGPNSASISEGLSSHTGLGATQSSIAGERSGSGSDYLAEPQTFLASSSYRGTQATPAQTEATIEKSHTVQQTSLWSNSSGIGSQSLELPSRQIDEAIPATDSLTDDRFYSPNFQSSNPIDSQSQLSQPFVTQVVPSSSTFETNSSKLNSRRDRFQKSGGPAKSQSQNSKTTQSDLIHRESESATLAQEFTPLQSLPATEPVVSSFEAAWRAAKVNSLTPQAAEPFEAPLVASQLNAPSSREIPSQSLSYRREAHSAEHNSTHVQSSLDNQAPQSKSQSKTSQEQRSQSSHFPTPPVEDLLPSIEQTLYQSSSAPARQVTPPSSEIFGNSSPIGPMSAKPSMEPSVKREEFDATRAIKERMAAKRLEVQQRQAERAMSSGSPLPAAFHPEAVELSASLPIQTNAKEEDVGADPPLNSFPLAEQASTSLDVLPSAVGEFLVPLPMVSYVRDMYNEELREHRDLTSLFVRDDLEVLEEEQVKEIDSMLENLRSICDHQDIYNDDFSTQQSEQISRIEHAKFAENCSTKCMFLAALLVRLKDRDLHIVVLARAGRMSEILQTVFELHNLNYCIAGDAPSSVHSSSLRITLHPTSVKQILVEPASAVIAFDSTSRDCSFLGELRSNMQHYLSGLAPLLSLVVTHSIEHLERCFNDDIDPIQKKIRLVKCLRQLGDSVGQLKAEHEDPAVAADAVAGYLELGAIATSWPLPPMPEIEEIDLSPESPHQIEFEVSLNVGSTTDSLRMSPSDVLHPSIKRQLENEDAMDTDSPKRQRVTPVPVELNADMDISHVSESVVQPSSGLPQSNSVPLSSNTRAEGDADQMSLLLQKVKTLEIQLRTREASEAQLRRINIDLESRCSDYETSIKHIQPKYQEALNDRGHFEHGAKEALVRETETRKRLATKEAEVEKLKEKNAAMALELSTAQKALASSEIPEVAEMAKMREEVAKVNTENERLQRRLVNMQNDLEYMRSNYQNSSSSAAEAASELRDIKEINVGLQAKADENRVRIHEIQRDEVASMHLATIKTLKSDVERLEKENEKMSDEIANMPKTSRRQNKGGGSNRGSPMPMSSPKRTIAKPFGGSRSGSPAVGEPPFGGPLLTPDGMARGTRWGHLQ